MSGQGCVVSGRDVTYPAVQKVVEFIVWQRVLFRGVVEGILEADAGELATGCRPIALNWGVFAHRVIEHLEVVGVFLDNAALVDVIAEHVVVHGGGFGGWRDAAVVVPLL